MIPRTVKMAAEVAAQLTLTDLDRFGNVILNGYATTGANLSGKLAWQYAETLSAPIPLPTVTSVRPALKGWTTNYMEYYTKLQPNGYGVNPGDPTGFNYNVHSFTQETGPVVSLGSVQPGSGYTPGVYTATPAIGGSGTGATLNITISPAGTVALLSLNAAGVGYTVGDGFTANIGPYDSPLAVFVTGITPTSPAGQSKWAQPPHRFNQLQVSNTTPPQYINNPTAIQYSFVYPVSDNPVPPPIDILS